MPNTLEMTKEQGLRYLDAKGLVYSHDVVFDDQHRLYFKKADGQDVFPDHSATFTFYPDENKFLVSDFT